MSNSYESIPGSGSSGDGGARSKNIIYLSLGVMAALGVVLVNKANSGSRSLDDSNWPEVLQKMDNSTGAGPYQLLGTNTKEATAKGWLKSDEACDPLLGEAWMKGGVRSEKYNGVVYYTPAVGDVPGVVSGIEADYYGDVEEKLIGKYFGEEKKSQDGTYRSISVALRDGKKENLCDNKYTVAPGNAPYIRAAPGMANLDVPVVADSKSVFKEGACIQNMGYHWASDIEGGKDLTYKSENLVPIVAMYSSKDNTINGIWFQANSRKQTAAFSGASNMWDYIPGLLQVNKPPLYFCSNFCGECEWTGTSDGWFSTMHWMFKNTYVGEDTESCQGKATPGHPVCRSGKYPTLVTK